MIIRNIIQLSYGIPGIMLYFLVFYVMIRIRQLLNRSFIVIYVIMALSNMVTWLNAWIYLKLTAEPFFFFYYEWLKSQPFLINLHIFLTFYLYNVQNIDLLLLTIDRFAAVRSMLNDTKMWRKYYLVVAIFLHSAAIAAQLVSSLPLDVKIYLNSDVGGYEFDDDDSGTSKKPIAAMIQLGFAIFVFLACSILNIFSLKYMRQVRSSKSSSIEKSFFAISFCIFLTQFLNLIVACMVTIFHSSPIVFGDFMRTVYEIVFYTSDLFSIGPVVYTLVLPGPIRRFLFRKTIRATPLPPESSIRISSS